MSESKKPNEYRCRDSWGIDVVSAEWADYMIGAAERSALFYLDERAHYKTQLAAVQARLDAVMMEYCPDEMTPEQVANWQANQCIAGGQDE